MRELDNDNLIALSQRSIVYRDFFKVVGRNMNNPDIPAQAGFWSGKENISALVWNVDTGAPELLPWNGAGGLIEISAIPSTIGIDVQKISVIMSQLDESFINLVRGYNLKQAKVEIFRGLFDTAGKQLSPAFNRFVGFIDEIEITTPAEGGTGSINVSCTSHTQELLRSNPATRSHEDQMSKYPGDDFLQDSAVVGDWGPDVWGSGEAKNPDKKGLFGWGGFLGFL